MAEGRAASKIQEEFVQDTARWKQEDSGHEDNDKLSDDQELQIEHQPQHQHADQEQAEQPQACSGSDPREGDPKRRIAR